MGKLLYFARRMPMSALLGVLGGILLLSVFLGLLLGYLPIGGRDLADILRYQVLGGESPAIGMGAASAVWDLRLPRVLLAACVGMGLSLSGAVMQAIFRNPMADPYIMGVSSGASLGVACAVFLGIGTALGAGSMGVGAFLGAVAVSAAAAAAAGRFGGYDISYLLILGIALGAVCAGVTGVLVYLGANSTGMDVTLYWLMGSVAAAKLPGTLILLVVVAGAAAFFTTQARILNLMLEGETAAIPLGRPLLPFMRLYLVLNALLVGCVVLNAGLIGFIGLLAPHFTRMLVGADHRRLIPAAVLFGGIAAVWADILGRALVPGVDIPLGVMLALMGAPAFIVMLTRRAYRFGGAE
ncbi:iron ABC transporter permease [Selenomonas sp. F0473]|uniref:FecCD family ABC transporter permease n=1 Tax=Selenomonas sp. F0473 TaxID=999423 RepID=UPI0006888F60|nr:iron ABC transporter permease [Selenomonas sp. F0473]